MPTDDDLLFAEHVVKAGFLTQEEVEDSLSVQRRMEEMGVHDTLRSVLVKRGVLREADAAVVARNAGLRSGGEPIPGYTLEARLGSGAMGSVYKAYQKGMKRHVAVKILRRDLTDDPRQVERLQREAALVGKLDHPNIVRGLDTGETEGLVWFVMELVTGESLRERILRMGKIPHEEAVRITRQLAEALDHAASLGIIHRDVKPGNILVAKDGTPRLTDYGLAKGESDDALTQLDATLGTPQYISPEQARNPRDADVRSDIYSLGATLYAMLTGHPPFAGETMAATLTKVLYERPKPLAEEAPDTPPALAYVVERMMAKDRRHRYQTPGELLHDLRALEEGRLVVPSGFKGDISAFVETRRHRRLVLVGAALVAGAVALAAGVLVMENRAAGERRANEAAHELRSLQKLAGPRSAWNGDTVQKMIEGYERIGKTYAGTPAADEALADVAHWAAQAAALRQSQDLALRAAAAPPAWPPLLDEIATRVAELRGVPDTSVALARVEALLAERRTARDRHATAESDRVAASAGDWSLAEASRRYATLAETLRTQYFGDARSELVEGARKQSAEFADAAARIERAFAPYELRAESEGGLARGEFRTLLEELDKAGDAAARDAELAKLLASLPPSGTRMGEVEARRELLRARLVAASAAAWETVRRDAEESRSRRAFDVATAKLTEFAALALDPERSKAIDVRDGLVRDREGAESIVRTAAEETSARFLEAIGRRDYALARDAVEELSVVGAAAPSKVNPASEFASGGRHLLDLIESLLREPLRARLVPGASLDRGLHVRSGIRYQSAHVVRLTGRELTIAHEGGQTASVSLDDVVLDDIVAYAGLTPSDPERALVLAAVRLTEFTPGADPTVDARVLGEMSALLDKVRAAPELQLMATRLARLCEDEIAAARAQKNEIEQRAEQIHRAALADMERGDHEKAHRQLQSLLEMKTLRRSDYVRQRRDEIEKKRDEAAVLRQSSGVAAKFPGASLTRRDDGTAEMYFDFESPAFVSGEARKVLSLVEGRTEIASRPAVIADRPAIVRAAAGGASVPLVLEHTLAWRPGDAASSPREFPVSLDCPFSMRGRIAVSFAYRSAEPSFLSVSIGCVTAGILSAPDERYWGRGIWIWGARDLARPDREFDDRYRATYQARHPEVLKKEGDRRFFSFEPGRTYRVEVVKDERKASVWVDGQLRFEGEWRPVTGALDGKVVLTSFGAAEVDDLRITGILDPEWLKGR
jgi:tRNA A-37 threonylcarbamoyl transferase component Bud32